MTHVVAAIAVPTEPGHCRRHRCYGCDNKTRNGGNFETQRPAVFSLALCIFLNSLQSNGILDHNNELLYHFIIVDFLRSSQLMLLLRGCCRARSCECRR